ncbi:hypothetical protein EDD15DRAFT_2201095 [Pisolithus albus]|nr:hypothetical protein EDD15DRAFT_2201095 [Pisolithus albus]
MAQPGLGQSSSPLMTRVGALHCPTILCPWITRGGAASGGANLGWKYQSPAEQWSMSDLQVGSLVDDELQKVDCYDDFWCLHSVWLGWALWLQVGSLADDELQEVDCYDDFWCLHSVWLGWALWLQVGSLADDELQEVDCYDDLWCLHSVWLGWALWTALVLMNDLQVGSLVDDELQEDDCYDDFWCLHSFGVCCLPTVRQICRHPKGGELQLIIHQGPNWQVTH